MPITADYHLHSSFSGDSQTPMEEMILSGISRGLTHMCFTEHMDIDYPSCDTVPVDYFTLNTDSYLYDLLKLREKYADRIKINFGVELGLQPHLPRRLAAYTKNYDFDFIIGSVHICNGEDPYFPPYFEGKTEKDAYSQYFSCMIDNLRKFSNFDVLGHLDYIVRYGKQKDQNYSYEQYKDQIDTILELLLDKGKGLEINTGGLKSGLKDVHPCLAILKRYREMGGEIVTIGSDSHDSIHIGDEFARAEAALKECGFRYYTIFENRLPEFRKL